MTSTERIPSDQGVISEGKMITFTALPFPLPKHDQNSLKTISAAIKAGEVSHGALERAEEELRKQLGFRYTRPYIAPVNREELKK